jgi:hypothetical protein
VSVIIPTWNGWALLQQALASLKEQTFRDFEIIVVDNGSSDDTIDRLELSWPEVRLVRFDHNSGFATAVNAGLSVAAGDILVLMNNDVEAEPQWIAALVRALEESPEVGSCASRVLSYQDRSRIDSAGDQLGFFAYAIGHGARDSADYHLRRYVFSPSAAAAAYRRAALDQSGTFDERFFAYLEDVDLGVRLQLTGWRCLYVPDAVVYHHGSATAARSPEVKLRLLIRNSLFLFFQYMPAATIIAWGPLMLLWPFWRSVREGRSPRLAVQCLAEFLGDWRAVLRRRAEAHRMRRVTTREFRTRLTGLLSRAPSRVERSGASGIRS